MSGVGHGTLICPVFFAAGMTGIPGKCLPAGTLINLNRWWIPRINVIPAEQNAEVVDLEAVPDAF